MPLTTLFLDMNSFYASVEQQERPELRGRPVGVAPVMADSSCCISASYEAKAFGIRTLTTVGDAKRLYPGVAIVQARPRLYVQYHERIIEAVDTVLPIEAVCSIDEMCCRLVGAERARERALELGRRVKQAIHTRIGPHVHCSVGIAPNRFLAKVATELQKPDGLVVIEQRDLPAVLFTLQLSDLPGIGKAMLARLHKKGIRTIEQLCAQTEPSMARIWNSVIGTRWHHWLRGHEPHEPPVHRRTIGHEHVLPPDLRHDDAARAVLMRLVLKAAMRLRHEGYWARRLAVKVRYLDGGAWRRYAALGWCADSAGMISAVAGLWEQRPRGTAPFVVGVTLDKLALAACAPLPLFPAEQRRLRASAAMDAVNQRFGRQTIYAGCAHAAVDEAPLRIAFTHVPDLDLEA
jgi:DNA polymerase-4